MKVEHLSVGDTITTLGNNTQRITWIGHGKVLATRGKRGRGHPGHRAQRRTGPQHAEP